MGKRRQERDQSLPDSPPGKYLFTLDAHDGRGPVKRYMIDKPGNYRWYNSATGESGWYVVRNK